MILNNKPRPCEPVFMNIKRNYVIALAYMVLKMATINAYSDAHLISSQYQMVKITDELTNVKNDSGLLAKFLNIPKEYIENWQYVIV
tara:strand:- start:1317 stop:1577 length:261 start_codon:yes stop_codon:yes gene_type:complete